VIKVLIMKNKMVALLVCGLLFGMLVTLIPSAEATDPFTVSIDRTEGSLKPGGSTTYFLSITNNLDANRTFVISVSVPAENFTATVEPSEVTILALSTYRFVEVTISADLEADIGDIQNTFIYVDNGRGISETLQITSTIEIVEAGDLIRYGHQTLPNALPVPVAVVLSNIPYGLNKVLESSIHIGLSTVETSQPLPGT